MVLVPEPELERGCGKGAARNSTAGQDDIVLVGPERVPGIHLLAREFAAPVRMGGGQRDYDSLGQVPQGFVGLRKLEALSEEQQGRSYISCCFWRTWLPFHVVSSHAALACE